MKRFLIAITLVCATVAASTADGILQDESFLNSGHTPGKRCANVYEEGCMNGGLLDSARDEDWLNTGSPGKRSLETPRIPLVYYLAAKRYCANALERERCVYLVLKSYYEKEAKRGVFEKMFGKTTKRCANVFEEGCINNGLSSAADDEYHLTDGLNPGKR